MLAAQFHHFETGFGFLEDADDLFLAETLLHVCSFLLKQTLHQDGTKFWGQVRCSQNAIKKLSVKKYLYQLPDPVVINGIFNGVSV